MPLVLTRRPGEAILIRTPQGNRRIYVVSIDGNVVRLAFEAPSDVEIIREELLTPEARAVWDSLYGHRWRRGQPG